MSSLARVSVNDVVCVLLFEERLVVCTLQGLIEIFILLQILTLSSSTRVGKNKHWKSDFIIPVYDAFTVGYLVETYIYRERLLNGWSDYPEWVETGKYEW